MRLFTSSRTLTWQAAAWCTTALVGVAVPVLIMLVLSARSSPLASVSGAIFTLGLMGVGIIAAATAGRFWTGVLLALLNAACLIGLALALGIPALLQPFSIGLAMVIASGSFAARGALFARTLSQRGWLMALFVVAGEASVLLMASALPGVLPNWFLALLPAQWASIAIQTALTGTGTLAAIPVLLALAGTAATTLLAATLWRHRWPYLLMFTAWLGLSALVYFRPAPTAPSADLAAIASIATPVTTSAESSVRSAKLNQRSDCTIIETAPDCPIAKQRRVDLTITIASNPSR